MSKVKNVAAVIVILGILALLFTSTSINIPVLNDIGKYINIPSFNLPIGTTPNGNPFPFSLQSSYSLLNSQTFTAQSSNVILVGANFASLQIGDSYYQPESGISAQIYNFNGQTQFNYGTISLSGQADSATIGTTGINPSTAGQKLKISAQFTAANYTISGLSKQPLTLQSIYGELTKMGASSASQDLVNESLKINGFQGAVQLSGNYLITGVAVSIQGNTFSWTG